MWSTQVAMLVLKNLLFTVIAPGTVAVALPWLIAGDRPAGSGAWLAGAVVLFATGGAIYLRCMWDFAAFGRGTPAPIDPPTRLVVRGLYRYLRNPMYVGVVTVILGWAVLYRAPLLVLYGCGMGVAFHGFVVLYEEPHLRRVFGTPYDDYCARVRRWIPGRPSAPGG